MSSPRDYQQQTFTNFPDTAENFRWEYDGLVRSALLVIPQDWMRRREILASASLPGFPIIIMLGGNDGRAFAQETALHQLVQDTIVIYPDPITLDGNNVKFDGGHGGQAASVITIDDAGSIAHLLHFLTNNLDDRYDAHRAAMSPGGVADPNAAFPRVVPAAATVHDPDRIFAFGYSGGALMAYRLAAESPLVPVGAPPGVSFAIRAIAVFAGTAGGYRQTETEGLTSMLVANLPTATCSILHVRGDDDDQVADAKFYTVGPGSAFATKIQSTTVVTAAFPGGTTYDGAPSGNEYTNRVSIMGYTSQIAHEMTRWDFTMDGSLQMWLDMFYTGAGRVVVPAYVGANVTPLPLLPAAPVASAASFEWFEVKAGLEPRVQAIRVLGTGHQFPMTSVGGFGTVRPGAPWHGTWNLAQYVVNFFATFP